MNHSAVGTKRRAGNGSRSTAVDKKIKAEDAGAGNVVNTEVDEEVKRTPTIRVELRLNTSDRYDSDSGDEKEPEYVDMEDEEKCSRLRPLNYGTKREYSCTRQGSARVLVDEVNIGSITFYLIDRAKIADGFCPEMVEVCDAETGELYDLALKYFEEDGSLKNILARRVGEMANYDYFLYIDQIDLKSPYDRLASDDNVSVAAGAIDKFVRSPAFNTNVVTATLAM